MENKKKAKVDYAAIIREFEMYGRGRSLKQFCDDSSYVYPNVLRYYRKCFWNSKSKLAASPNGDKSLVSLEIESAASVNSASSSCGLLQARRTDYAFMFSVIESCYMNKLSPRCYIKELVSRLTAKSVCTAKKVALLPCVMQK